MRPLASCVALPDDANALVHLIGCLPLGSVVRICGLMSDHLSPGLAVVFASGNAYVGGLFLPESVAVAEDCQNVAGFAVYYQRGVAASANFVMLRYCYIVAPGFSAVGASARYHVDFCGEVAVMFNSFVGYGYKRAVFLL